MPDAPRIIYSHEAGDDLPKHCTVTRGGPRPQYRWRCLACGTSKRFYSLVNASDQAWAHYVHLPCDELEVLPS